MIGKILIGLLILMLVSGGIAFYYFSLPKSLSDTQRQAQIEQTLGRKQIEVTQTPTGTHTYSSSLITFSYPASAKIYNLSKLGDTPQANLLERFSFDMYSPRMTFVYTATKTDSSQINDVSGVALRRTKKDTYKEEPISISGIQGSFFNKTTQDGEATAFIIRKHIVYTFSFTAQYFSEDLASQLKTLLASVTFL